MSKKSQLRKSAPKDDQGASPLRRHYNKPDILVFDTGNKTEIDLSRLIDQQRELRTAEQVELFSGY